jgi:TRAP-type C4-dicarboxylate transport system permease small subunit
MKKFNAFVGRIETLVGVCMMTVIVVMVFIGAVSRYFKSPIVWSVDLAQLLFIWVCMFGADAALKNRAHVGMDMIVKLFAVKVQKLVTLATYILCLVFLVFLVIYGVNLCISNYLRMYATLKVSYSYGTAAVPVGAALMILTLLEQLCALVAGWADPGVGVVGQSASATPPLPPIS